MATLATPIIRSSSLTEKEYAPLAPYSEESGAVLTHPTEVVVTLQNPGWVVKPIAVQARVTRQISETTTHIPSIPNWVRPTVEGVGRIMQLPPNWDSYGAQPVQSVLVGKALEILPRVMLEDSPPPSIVPLTDGGLQMEWHLKGRDLEIVVAADESPTYYYRDPEASPEEGSVSTAFERLRSIIQELT